MIATLAGVLAERAGESIVIQTDGGVGYAVTVSLGVYERLPAAGARVSLFTELVIREDEWLLFGFDTQTERQIFQRLLGAAGFGPRLALALLSALGPDRTVRSIQERNLAALASVSGIGKKKAERLVLELQDKFGDLPVAPSAAPQVRGAAAVRALTTLGYPAAQAEDAVRATLDEGGTDETEVVLRRALVRLSGSKGGTH